jgi:hypothetical protein
VVEAEALKWEVALIQQCNKLLQSSNGGEIRIIFRPRRYKAGKVVLPIINIYEDNQIICEEVK